jgi:hypothetical protein
MQQQKSELMEAISSINFAARPEEWTQTMQRIQNAIESQFGPRENNLSPSTEKVLTSYTK